MPQGEITPPRDDPAPPGGPPLPGSDLRVARSLQAVHEALDGAESQEELARLLVRATRPDGLPDDLRATLLALVRILVVSDAAKLRQILLHVAGNAVKSTARGGVTLSAAAGPDGGVVVRVEDTGPGIPADQVEFVFQPFTQLDTSSTRPDAGTGLGLAISRRLAGLLGGTLVLEDPGRRGAAFALRLPDRLESAP